MAKQDIKEGNILVNGYCPDATEPRDILTAHLRSSPKLAFCLFDFDLSIQAPPGASLEDYRRPSDESSFGSTMYHPQLDVSLAQPEYNPFAYDVGCLGNMLISFVAVSTTPHRPNGG